MEAELLHYFGEAQMQDTTNTCFKSLWCYSNKKTFRDKIYWIQQRSYLDGRATWENCVTLIHLILAAQRLFYDFWWQKNPRILWKLGGDQSADLFTSDVILQQCRHNIHDVIFFLRRKIPKDILSQWMEFHVKFKI